MRNLQSLDCHVTGSRAGHSRLPFWKGFANLGSAGHTAMEPAWFCINTHMNSSTGCKSSENMKGQEGHVLSAKLEFIAPCFTLSHRSLAVSAALRYEPCLSFWLGLFGFFGGLFGFSLSLLGSYLFLVLA